MGKTLKYRGRKVFNVWWLFAKENIKEIIGIKKVDNNKVLIGADDKLPDGVSLKNVVILMTYIINDDGKFYPKLF